MSSSLLNTVVTCEDQKKLIEELSLLEEGLYKTEAGNWQDVLNSKLRKAVAVIIEEETRDAVIDKKSYVREIIESLKKLKTIKLTIAVQPTQEVVNSLANWITSKLGAGIVIDISVDKRLLGGTKIAFEGRYVDLSLDTKWQYAWANKRTELLTAFGFN